MAEALDVLVVSQFFHPEMGAPAARFYDFGRLLIEHGHRVRVITGFPSFPSGRIPPGYRGRLVQREVIDGIEVHRGWLFASPHLTPATKSLGFASFATSASLLALLGRLRADVVVATSPPPTVGIPGLVASRRLRAPLVFDVRDIWPEALAASGRLESGVLIRTLERLQDAIYRASAAITVVTEGKRDRLLEQGISEAKVRVIPNGVNLERFDEVKPLPASSLGAFGIDSDRFIVIYAGVFNPPQGLDVLLEAAVELRGNASRVQFVLVGHGSERARLEQRARALDLDDRVRFLPEQPRENIPALLRSADAVAVTLRPRRDTHTVPSKLYEAMASGRPILVSADGAPAEIVRAGETGLATSAADARGLARSVRLLLEDPDRARALGERGRRYAARFDRRVLVGQFEEVLHTVAHRGRE